MLSRPRVFLWAASLTIVFSSLTLWASKEFVPPKAGNASTYACKDSHPTEHITAAVEVYNNPPKSDIFITHYSEEGILPVFLVITNDGDQPVSRRQGKQGRQVVLPPDRFSRRSTKVGSPGPRCFRADTNRLYSYQFGVLDEDRRL